MFVYSMAFTRSESVKWEWGRKNSQFSANNSPYLRNGARQDQSYYACLLGSRIRPFDWCENQRPWMTFNSWYGRYYTKDASFGAHHKNLNEDRYSISGKNVYIGQWGCRQRQFSAFTLAISLETLEMRPALLYSDTQSFVSFSVIPKCVSLNGLEWLFRVKFCVRADLTGSDRATFENNIVKTYKDRHILSAAQIFGRDFSFWQYKVCAAIRSGSLERRR